MACVSVPHVPRLHLAEGLRSLIVEAAAVLRGAALLSPVEVLVSVDVSALTLVTIMPRCRLTPHPVPGPGVLVAIGVHAGHDVHVESLEENLVFGRVLHHLSCDVGTGSGGDPFSVLR